MVVNGGAGNRNGIHKIMIVGTYEDGVFRVPIVRDCKQKKYGGGD